MLQQVKANICDCHWNVFTNLCVFFLSPEHNFILIGDMEFNGNIFLQIWSQPGGGMQQYYHNILFLYKVECIGEKTILIIIAPNNDLEQELLY